eukprot:8908447-Alexandrium_andersonii.AAC.1
MVGELKSIASLAREGQVQTLASHEETAPAHQEQQASTAKNEAMLSSLQKQIDELGSLQAGMLGGVGCPRRPRLPTGLLLLLIHAPLK